MFVVIKIRVEIILIVKLLKMEPRCPYLNTVVPINQPTTKQNFLF